MVSKTKTGPVLPKIVNGWPPNNPNIRLKPPNKIPLKVSLTFMKFE